MLPIRIEHHWRDIAASIPQLPCACWFVKQEREIEYCINVGRRARSALRKQSMAASNQLLSASDAVSSIQLWLRVSRVSTA
jgi:hypothetical protein